MKSDKCGVMFQNGVCCCGCGRRVGSTAGHALTAEFIRDLLSSDGQRRPGDENLTGLAEALRPLDKELRQDVTAALYTYAAERLDAAENAETRAMYLSPDEFRARNLITAERLARLWREACGCLSAPLADAAPVEFCAARDCPKVAVWASPIMPMNSAVSFLVPVCREHGTALSPVHGVVGLDNSMRRKPCEWPRDPSVSP